MKKLLHAILKSRLFISFINPRYKRVPKVEKGTLCIVPCLYNRLGDLVMHNYAVQQLSERYNIVYGLTEKYYNTYRHFFDHHSLTKDFILLPEKKWKWIFFIFSLRARRIDAVVFDILPLVKEAFFFFGKVPVIVSCKGTSPFATREYFIDKFDFHYIDRVNLVLDMLGAEGKTHYIAPFFPFKPNNIRQLRKARRMLLTVHQGGATYWMRRWPVENYYEVCRLFLSHYEGTVLLIGGKEEYADNENLKDRLSEACGSADRVINFSGVDLNSTANIIASTDVYLGNDSGPMHIAVALNVRVVSIFGPSSIPVVNPTRYDQKNVTIHHNLPCIPCNRLECQLEDDKKYSCLTELPVEPVWKKLQSTIQAHVYAEPAI
jgi:ADP-heptose:LPS heptosyltransferase